METPFLRAKAKDTADELDNIVAYLEQEERFAVEQYVIDTFRSIEQVLLTGRQDGNDLLEVYRTFVSKFSEYYHPETAAI